MKLSLEQAIATICPTTHPEMVRLGLSRIKLKAQKRRSIPSWVTIFKAMGMVSQLNPRPRDISELGD